MELGKRKFNQLKFVLTHKETYIATFKAFKILKKPLRILFEEIFSKNIKTNIVKVKTPSGLISIKIFDKVDLSTILGIFCRQDYKVPETSKIILDIGANIGIASLYFLTHCKNSFVYAYEPVPTNIKKYLVNLSDFTNRFKLEEAAIIDRNGIAEFTIERTGKFGSLNKKGENTILVPTYNINTILEEIIKKHKKIDCIKIDVEGSEELILKSINDEYWPYIGLVYAENSDSTKFMPANFIRSWQYNVEKLEQKI